MQAALRAAERGATLTRHLLAFARRQHLDPKPVDVLAVAMGAEKILRQAIGPEIQLVIQPKPFLCAAWIDPNQLELAILNLTLNARDAMPSGGTLSIEAQNRQAGIGNSPPDLPVGDYVIVSVSDTGLGMTEGILARAFEPFFTTKEAGRGSGLGLSIVHGFAAQSGGSAQITSSPGAGTKVDLWLPRAEGAVTRDCEPEPYRSAVAPSYARILVCDDDADVLAFVGSVLRDCGYAVWEAATPSQVFEIIEEEWAIELLLVDYAMPEMNGLRVIDRARACRPGLKVLLISGHANILHAGSVVGVPSLAKPFKIAELRRRVVEILSAPQEEILADARSSQLADDSQETRSSIQSSSRHREEPRPAGREGGRSGGTRQSRSAKRDGPEIAALRS